MSRTALAGREAEIAGSPAEDRRFIAYVVALLAVVGAVIYGSTLRLSYAYDDIDHLNLAADYLSGRLGLVEMLLRPHHEHVVPAFRALVVLAVKVVGTTASPVRLGTLLVHVGSGALLAALCLRLTRCRAAATAAGLAYVVPAGLSSMLVWFPSGAIFPLGTLGITAATLLVTLQPELGRRRALVGAGAGIAFALILENALFPLAAGPALLDEVERRRHGRPARPIGPLTLFSLLVSIGAVSATFLLQHKTAYAASSLELWPALGRFAFLALVVPFRLAFPAQHLPSLLRAPGGSAPLAAAFGLVAGGVVGLVLVGLNTAKARPLLVAGLCALPGPIGFIGLVALARVDMPPGELFDSDRYFFPFLVPVAIVFGVLASSISQAARSWSRGRKILFGGLLFLVLAPELALHAMAVRRRVPSEVYDRHARRFDQLRRLSALLEEASSSPVLGGRPLEIPDEAFYFDDVHNKRLSVRLLLFVVRPPRPGTVVLAGPTPGGLENARIVSDVFSAWAREYRDPDLEYRLTNGHLRRPGAASVASFTTGPEQSVVGTGFYDWESTHRWMAKEGTLQLLASGSRFRLRFGSPPPALSRLDPSRSGVTITVAVRARGEEPTRTIGSIRADFGGGADATVEVPAALFAEIRDRTVTVILSSSIQWRPKDVLPGATDERVLSIMVFEAGFVE